MIYRYEIFKAPWFFRDFDDFSKFHDFPWLLQKFVFFQVFQTLGEPWNKWWPTSWTPYYIIRSQRVNPLRAKFFRGSINIYLHFMSFLHIDLTQVLKILPQVREGPTYSIYSISWLLMSWWRKEPGHQQPWHWCSQTEITRSPHVKG